MKRILFVLLCALAVTAQANPYYYGSGQQRGYSGERQQQGGQQQYGAQQWDQSAPAEPQPDDILRQGMNRLQGFLSRGGAPSEEDAKAFLYREIAPFFDFQYMAQWAGGRLLNGMSEQEQMEFGRKLSVMFLDALATNLGAYANTTPRIDIYRSRGKPGSGEVVVPVLVSSQRGRQVRMKFRFYRAANGWKIFDVIANGSSAVAYYRGYFNKM